MRSLADEKDGRADDEARIAKLERSLANAMAQLVAVRSERSEPAESAESAEPAESLPSSKDESRESGATLLVLGAFASVVLVGLYFVGLSGNDVDDSEYYQTSGPSNVTELSPASQDEFDVTAGIAKARWAARGYFSPDIVGDPELVGIRAGAVNDQGLSVLRYGGVTYFFKANLAPLAVEHDDAPVGARRRQRDTRPCHAEIHVDRSGIHAPTPIMAMMPFSPFTSRCETLAVEPSCTVAEVRERAIAQGAPSGAVASVSLGDTEAGIAACGKLDCIGNEHKACCQQDFDPKEYRPNWQVVIVDEGRARFSASIPDDCGLLAEKP